VDLLFRRRLGDEGGCNHYKHAKYPIGECAVIERIESSQQFKLPKSPTEGETEHHCGDGRTAICPSPQDSQREYHSERRRNEKQDGLDFLEERRVGQLSEDYGYPN